MVRPWPRPAEAVRGNPSREPLRTPSQLERRSTELPLGASTEDAADGVAQSWLGRVPSQPCQVRPTLDKLFLAEPGDSAPLTPRGWRPSTAIFRACRAAAELACGGGPPPCKPRRVRGLEAQAGAGRRRMRQKASCQGPSTRWSSPEGQGRSSPSSRSSTCQFPPNSSRRRQGPSFWTLSTRSIPP